MSQTIVEIYERCKKILYFLASLPTDEKSKNLFSDFSAVLDATYGRKDLRSLKIINRDLDAWAKSLNAKQKNELNQLLESNKVYKQQEELIDRVKREKKISTKEDYQQVINILKDLNEGDKHFSDVKLLERLVADYESS